jgi:LysR family hydrogen peroxide-inducible transcriptional activator
VAVAELAGQRTLLLGAGHCFRDQVLDACPELQRGGSPGSAGSTGRPIEGSSLETIRQMVASGIGVAVLPATAVPARVGRGALVNYLPFRGPAPCRRVGLAWRRSFPRPEAIRVLLQGLRRCRLPPVRWLEPETE